MYNLRSRPYKSNIETDANMETQNVNNDTTQSNYTQTTTAATTTQALTTNENTRTQNYEDILFGGIPESERFLGFDSPNSNTLTADENDNDNANMADFEFDRQEESRRHESRDQSASRLVNEPMPPSSRSISPISRQTSPPSPVVSPLIRTADAPVNNAIQMPQTSTASEPNLITQIAVMLNTQLNSLNSQLNTRLDKLKYELKEESNAQLTNLKSDLDARLQENNESVNEIKSDISVIKSDMHNEFKSLKSNIHQITQNVNSLKSDIDMVKVEVTTIQTVLTEHSDKIDQIETNIENKLQKQTIEIREQVNHQIVAHQNLVENNMKNLSTNLTKTIDTKIYNQSIICQSNLLQHSEEITCKIDNQDEKIKELTTVTNIHSNRIAQVEQQVSQQIATVTPNIYVTCTGNGGSPIETNPPKFHGRMSNPREFLSKLKRFYERSLNNKSLKDEPDHLIDIIDQCLDQHAAKWFELIKNQIKTWSDFETMFVNKYWNHEVQRGIKQRIEVERYRPDGKLSRAEYFIDKVLVLRSITPPLSDEEIVTILADHFSELVQDARRVQNVHTVHEFELLLQREDLKDAHQRSRNYSSRPEQPLQRQPNGNHSPGHRPSYNPGSRPPNSPPRHSQYNNRYNGQRGYSNNNHNNSGYQHNNNYNQRGRGGYNNPNYQRNNQNRREENQYPTKEQSQVCSAIVIGRNSPQADSNTSPPNPPLN